VGVLGPVLVFALVWVVIAFRRVRWLPIGRPAGALAGAVGMVAVGALTPEQAWRAVDGGTIALLLGMMLITAYLQRAGWFGFSAHRLVGWARSPVRLLLAIAWSAAALSAVLVNDTVCLFMTPLVLDLVRRARLPPGPYLIALATSANIGSAATLVGNPQNMLIGSMSGIRFLDFLLAVGPAAVVGMAVHTAILLLAYRPARLGSETGRPTEDPAPPGGDAAPNAAPGPSGGLAREAGSTGSPEAPKLGPDAPLVGLVFVLVVTGFLAGLDLGFTALAGAVALMILDRREPTEAFAAVDWSLLLFFAGLFVVVAGLGATGLPDRAWAAAGPWMSLESAGGLAGLSGALAVGSNVVSNVPLVLLVGPHLAALGRPELSWPLLGFVTTVAGNLTLVGSVANLIVAEQARDQYELGFFEYLAVGFPSTVAVTAVGVALLALGG
jgi:Na+/H+ antiporter NhaD/arsenite permease-like protein